MKKTIIASLAVLASAAVLTTFALVGGAGKLGGVQVNADPVQDNYSFTFNESNTTVEEVDGDYAIYATTPRGAKVGVVGHNDNERDDGKSSFTFNGASFWHLCLFDNGGALGKVGANDFDLITGFAISFSGGLGVAYESSKTGLGGEIIPNGEKYDVSIRPSDTPQFYAGGNVTVTSLTIWYSCPVL